MMKRSMKRILLSCFLLMGLAPLNHVFPAESTWSQIDKCTESELNDVWGSSCSDAYAVGNSGTIVHYNGSTCSELDIGTNNYLQGIWGRSASDIFIVGYNGFIAHFDGTNWSTMNGGTENHLYAVWGCQGGGVFAVGEKGTILYYNGSTWQRMASNMSKTLYGIWGSSCNDVFAIGVVDDLNYQGKPFTASAILHYDGNSDYRWDPMENKQNETLRDVWGCGECNVFAIGDKGTLINYDCTYDEDRESFWHFSEKNISFVQDGAPCGMHGYLCNNIFVVGRGRSYECNDYQECSEISDLEDELLSDVHCTNEDLKICCWAVGSSGAVFETKITITTTTTTSTPIPPTTTCKIPVCCVTKIYGDDSENTALLRRFRDEVLKKTPEGQEMIRLYYESCPLIVKSMEQDEAFKKSVKETLDDILPIIKSLVK